MNLSQKERKKERKRERERRKEGRKGFLKKMRFTPCVVDNILSIPSTENSSPTGF